jgi:hypothetical protein
MEKSSIQGSFTSLAAMVLSLILGTYIIELLVCIKAKLWPPGMSF